MLTLLKQAPMSGLLALIALLAFAIPGANALLELDFNRVAEGQLWRVVTGHWTHFGASHLFWDLLMFVVLAFACETKAGKWFGPAVGFMALFCSAAVAITCSQITVYRGLSGLDTGLFTWFVAGQIGNSLSRKEWASGTLYLTMLAGLLGKLAFEASTGETLFVAAGDFQPLVEVHLAGAIVGLVYSVLPAIYQKAGPQRRASFLAINLPVKKTGYNSNQSSSLVEAKLAKMYDRVRSTAPRL